jgi:hypothetical protein
MTLNTSESLLAPFRQELEDYILAPEMDYSSVPALVSEFEVIEKARSEKETKDQEQKAVEDAEWMEEA